MWCKRQIKWLLGNLDALRQGRWISQGLIEAQRARAPLYESALQTLAELHTRLDTLGSDRKLLVDLYSDPETNPWSVARAMGIPTHDLKERSRRALRYISGDDRKPYSYEDYCQHRRVAEGEVWKGGVKYLIPVEVT